MPRRTAVRSPARDYVAANGTLNWADADSAPKYITVSLNNNPAIGAAKSFTINLTGTIPAPVTPSTATVGINQPPFESWVLANFGANANDAAIAGAGVDYNGDGFTNLQNTLSIGIQSARLIPAGPLA